MKMIGHETVSIGIHHPVQMLSKVLEEEAIILLLPENILRTVGVVVDMVGLAGFQLLSFIDSY